jgi:hypothetical protein
VIARARLRAGNTASATGAGRLLGQAIKTARAAGVTLRLPEVCHQGSGRPVTT